MKLYFCTSCSNDISETVYSIRHVQNFINVCIDPSELKTLLSKHSYTWHHWHHKECSFIYEILQWHNTDSIQYTNTSRAIM